LLSRGDATLRSRLGAESPRVFDLEDDAQGIEHILGPTSARFDCLGPAVASVL